MKVPNSVYMELFEGKGSLASVCMDFNLYILASIYNKSATRFARFSGFVCFCDMICAKVRHDLREKITCRMKIFINIFGNMKIN